MGYGEKIKKLSKKMIGRGDDIEQVLSDYVNRYNKYAFKGEACIDERQYEAVITRLYHTVEKGLAYVDYRANFGRANIDRLIRAMEGYAESGYDTEAFFYKTALSVLNGYTEKNRLHGEPDEELEKKIMSLKGSPNEAGGTRIVKPLSESEVRELDYRAFVADRHSFRHFSEEPVSIEVIIKALELAQLTPSACNRQGWRTVIIDDKEKIKTVCANQNGNKGFGHEFDKMLLVVGDLRCFNKSRELFQVYIDGGMYAQSVLNALHYYHVASVPLSASLTADQEKAVRSLLGLHEAEVPIMLIGVGNYPPDEECVTARSERKPARIETIK